MSPERIRAKRDALLGLLVGPAGPGELAPIAAALLDARADAMDLRRQLSHIAIAFYRLDKLLERSHGLPKIGCCDLCEARHALLVAIDGEPFPDPQ